MNASNRRRIAAGLIALAITACTPLVSLAQSTTNLWEDFRGLTNATATGTDIGANLDLYTQMPGWTGSKVYDYTNIARVGTSSAQGFISTPSLDLSGNGGGASLSFRSYRWTNDTTLLKVLMDGIQQGNDITLTDNLTPYQISLVGGTSTSKVTFTSDGATRKRFYLDDILIMQDASVTNLPLVLINAYTSPVEYAVSNVTLTGTANANVVGLIAWTNALTGAKGTIAAAANWSIPNIALAVGTNVISVAGTNSTGQASLRLATIVRMAQDYVGTPQLGPVTGIDSTTFTVNWTSAPYATGYLVEVATHPAFFDGAGSILFREGFDLGLWNGWEPVTIAGAQTWTLAAYGLDGTYGARMNGYSTTETNEDWLVSPSLDLSGSTQPLFSFMSALNYAGPPLQVLVSTNLPHAYAVHDAGVTWTPLAATFGPTGYEWTFSGQMDLTAFRSASTYVAFKYMSSIGSGFSLDISLDDLQLREGSLPGPSDLLPGYDPCDAGAANSLQVVGLTEGVTYYFRVRGYNAYGTGSYSSAGSVVTVSASLPALAITSPAVATSSVPNEVETVNVSGTANAYVTGLIGWINDLGGSGSIAAATDWTISGIPLTVGTNQITVTATNATGAATNATVAVVRLPTGILVNENFDGGTNAPAGWTFVNIDSTYSGANYVGLSAPSIKLDTTNDAMITKTFVGGTNVSFFFKGNPASGISECTGVFHVLQFDGSSWTTLASITNPSAVATTLSFDLAENIVQLQFRWDKVTGNIGIDDVVVTGTGIGPAVLEIVAFTPVVGTQYRLTWTGATAACTVSMSTNLTLPNGFTPVATNLTEGSVILDAAAFSSPVFFRVEQ